MHPGGIEFPTIIHVSYMVTTNDITSCYSQQLAILLELLLAPGVIY
jgi:hypothetical protein